MKALWITLMTLVTACGGNGSAPDAGAQAPEKSAPPPAATAPLKVLPVLPAPATQPSREGSAVSANKKPMTPASEVPPPSPAAPVTKPEPVPEPVSCEAQGRVTDEDGRTCRDKRFVDYCRTSIEIDEEEQLTVSRILNGLQLSDCADVERYLERQPTLILPPHGQKITDLRPIGTLKMLRALHVANNRIVDVSPLAGLRDLEVLNLRGNAVSDLSPLTSLGKLRRLDISGNDARDLSALAKMPHLTRIQTGPVSDPVAIEKREPVTMRGISTGTLE